MYPFVTSLAYISGQPADACLEHPGTAFHCCNPVTHAKLKGLPSAQDMLLFAFYPSLRRALVSYSCCDLVWAEPVCTRSVVFVPVLSVVYCCILQRCAPASNRNNNEMCTASRTSRVSNVQAEAHMLGHDELCITWACGEQALMKMMLRISPKLAALLLASWTNTSYIMPLCTVPHGVLCYKHLPFKQTAPA